MTLTVIMPVYNTGNKLKATLNSILKQDFTDFELLLIDDGSTDTATKKICENYRCRDSRVKVFIKENEGIEKTKILGIKKAQGDFIIFSDHDDLYLPGAFSKLVGVMMNTDADIVTGNYYEQLFRFLPLKTRGFTIDRCLILSHKDFVEKFYFNFFGVNLFNVSTWAKIYKSKLLKDIDFITLGFNTTEDVVLNLQIFPKAEKIVFIKDFLYIHIRGGITSKPDPSIILKNYEVLYVLKQKYINQYNLFAALPYINYEKRNVLEHFVNLSVESEYSQDFIVRHLELFKSSSTYKDVAAFYERNQISDRFMNQYLAGDYKTIYLHAIKNKNKITLKKLIKKIIQ